jgi:catalase
MELPTTSVENRPAPLIGASALPRLVGIGILILAIAGAFLQLGGWPSPRALTPARLINGLERANGIYPGFRRNAAKGVCVNGFFDSNGQGMRLSRATVFKVGRLPVIGRFSLSGGNPYVADAPDKAAVWGFRCSYPMARNGARR